MEPERSLPCSQNQSLVLSWATWIHPFQLFMQHRKTAKQSNKQERNSIHNPCSALGNEVNTTTCHETIPKV
jgi:hypothetical protein